MDDFLIASITVIFRYSDLHSIISIATMYGLDTSVFELRRGREFLHSSWLAPSQDLVRWGICCFTQSKAVGRCVPDLNRYIFSLET
jgi:uncharacterized membrane protein